MGDVTTKLKVQSVAELIRLTQEAHCTAAPLIIIAYHRFPIQEYCHATCRLW